MLTVPVAPEHGFTSGLDSVTLVTWMVSVVARAPAGEAVSTPPANAATASTPSNDPNRFIATSPSLEHHKSGCLKIMFASRANERRVTSPSHRAYGGWRAACQASMCASWRQQDAHPDESSAHISLVT